MTNEQAIAGVAAVYADLAKRSVERDCVGRAECCQFKLTGLTPMLTRGEALYTAKAVRASGRKRLPVRKDGACPLLDPATAKCMAYEGRPFGCRTHFCKAAGGPYARREVLDLIRTLETIDAQTGGCGPRAFESAVSAVL